MGDYDQNHCERSFDQSWSDWLVRRLLAHHSHASLVTAMVESGFPEEFAADKVTAIAGSPILRSLPDELRRARKIAGMADLYCQLFRGSGFRLERLRLTPDDFYSRYFFRNLPVVLTGLTDGWPASEKWSPAYFKDHYGEVEVEITADRNGDALYEGNFETHRRSVSLGRFVDMIEQGGATNDYYMVARNQTMNDPALQSLKEDIFFPEGFLDPQTTLNPYVRLWFGPPGTVTPFHVDNRNALFVQVRGRKLVRLVPPQFLASLYNDHSCYSPVDLDAIDTERFPAMKDVPVFEVVLEPGDALFIPITWWHWVKALDVSISLTFTNFFHNEPEMVWWDATS